MKTYNELYINTRNTLKRAEIEAYALEARVLVASAAGKTVQQLLRDLNLYTTDKVEALVQEYICHPDHAAAVGGDVIVSEVLAQIARRKEAQAG